MMTDDPWLVLSVLAISAILIDAALPQRGQHTWDNKRAATQRDVAEVVGGRGTTQSGPGVLPLVALLIVLFGIAVVFGR